MHVHPAEHAASRLHRMSLYSGAAVEDYAGSVEKKGSSLS